MESGVQGPLLNLEDILGDLLNPLCDGIPVVRAKRHDAQN
jgi:hypothetical protein